MACSFSIRAITASDPKAAPSRYPLKDSVFDGPMIVTISSGPSSKAHRWV